MISVMFVCLGNICRSPAGEGLLSHLTAKKELPLQLQIASSGIGDWHVGELPDKRMRQAAMDRGVALTSRAQVFKTEDFIDYDYILAADREILHELYKHARSPSEKAKITLMTAFSPTYTNEEVPDPYYGGRADFDLVLDMLEDACEGLITEIVERHVLRKE